MLYKQAGYPFCITKLIKTTYGKYSIYNKKREEENIAILPYN